MRGGRGVYKYFFGDDSNVRRLRERDGNHASGTDRLVNCRTQLPYKIIRLVARVAEDQFTPRNLEISYDALVLYMNRIANEDRKN